MLASFAMIADRFDGLLFEGADGMPLQKNAGGSVKAQSAF
jgi:hypothetical protein